MTPLITRLERQILLHQEMLACTHVLRMGAHAPVTLRHHAAATSSSAAASAEAPTEPTERSTAGPEPAVRAESGDAPAERASVDGAAEEAAAIAPGKDCLGFLHASAGAVAAGRRNRDGVAVVAGGNAPCCHRHGEAQQERGNAPPLGHRHLDRTLRGAG